MRRTVGSKRKLITWTGGVLVAALAIMWVYGEVAYPRTNPPERHTGPILSTQADPILRRACFDCHSNETRYPWYSSLPGANLLLGQDVHEGRSKLNFSLWDRLPPQKQRKNIKEALEEVQDGEMPLAIYTFIHANARLSSQEVAQLQRDAIRHYGLSGRDLRESGGERGERGEGGERWERGKDDDD